MTGPRLPEPQRAAVRHTPVKPAGPALGCLVLACLLLSGCGSLDRRAAAASPRASPSDSCASPPSGARVLASVDLDGDGAQEPVRATPAQGDCPAGLSVEVDGWVQASLPPGQPPVRTAFGVELAGRDGQLLVTRQVHPRGGFQDRVYAYADGELAELRDGGAPLVPFVALDVQERPLSVDCLDGRLVRTEAVAHEPPGVVFAWDVRRTAYAVDGTSLRKEDATEVADNVLPARLERTYPDLVRHRSFGSCRAD